MENISLSGDLQTFPKIYLNTLDKFALRKKKYSRGNNMPFVNKSLFDAYTEKSRLSTCYI